MFPKLKLAGFETKSPCATPAPESGIESVALLAFELMVSAPVTDPAAAGVKIALKTVLWPPVRVIGRL